MAFLHPKHSAHWLLLTLALLAGSAQAVWYEASGTAPIIDGNLEKARQRATAEALRNASLYAGTSISSRQSVSSGILQDDSWSFNSSSEIRKTQIIAEKRSGDQLTITLRADIFSEPSCAESQLSHKLTVARFPLAHRQQASHGGIYELGGAASKVLHGLFQQQSSTISSQLWLDEVVSYQPTKLEPQPQVDELARTLARRTNSQYILLGQIRDISVGQQEKTHLAFWTHPIKPRSLALEVDLIDGISGERIKRFNYQDRVSWQFAPNQSVDPYSADFWQSDYGKAWGYLLNNVQRDVEASLACMPSMAHIISRQEMGIVVNMGEQDGIQKGQKAQLSRLGTFMDAFGRVKTSIHASGVELTVTHVEAKQAILSTQEPAHMAGIQNQDLVIFRPPGG